MDKSSPGHAHFESRDFSPKFLTWVALGLMGVLLLTFVGISVYYKIIYKTGGQHLTQPFTHGPEEKTGIEIDRAAMTKEFDQHLKHYRWIDRDAGIAAIPIDEAMKIVARNGLPDWGNPDFTNPFVPKPAQVERTLGRPTTPSQPNAFTDRPLNTAGESSAGQPQPTPPKKSQP